MTTEKQLGPSANQPHPSRVGFLLVDESFIPVYVNAEAVQILTYAHPKTETEALDTFLSDMLRRLFNDDQSVLAAGFASGRRQYFCRVLPVEGRSEVPSHATAVLIERGSERSIDVAQAAAEFQLSSREEETVAHLLQGLTSKEIAREMDISPYTVKTYVRLVMIKMGVTTRSGIVGKLVRGSTRQQ